MESFIKVVGNICIKKYDENNNLIDTVSHPNLVVNGGKEFIARRIAGNTSLISHIGVGSGTTVAVGSDTSLEIEIDRSNLLSTATVSNTAVTFAASFANANAVGTLSEAGLFNSANISNSTMICRTVFPGYAKGSNETIAISWTLTVI